VTRGCGKRFIRVQCKLNRMILPVSGGKWILANVGAPRMFADHVIALTDLRRRSTESAGDSDFSAIRL
jgi:hypothetical protein